MNATKFSNNFAVLPRKHKTLKLCSQTFKTTLLSWHKKLERKLCL